MKPISITLLLLSIALISKAQNNNPPSDTLLFKIEILKGTLEEVQEGAKLFKLKFPSIKTNTNFVTPNFVLVTTCHQREKTDALMKELLQEYPNLKIWECKNRE